MTLKPTNGNGKHDESIPLSRAEIQHIYRMRQMRNEGIFAAFVILEPLQTVRVIRLESAITSLLTKEPDTSKL